MSATQSIDSDQLVLTGAEGQVTNFRIPSFHHTTLGRFVLWRLIKDRDVKIVITSKGTTTGTGKTTLAIHLCRWIREVAGNEVFDADKEWSADHHAMIDVREYLDSYREADQGDALLLDEIELGADRRRTQSTENVHLTQALAKLRYKNVATVATLPGSRLVDQRVLELSDIWINVVKRGRANTYYMTGNDFTGEMIYRRLRKHGYREAILWRELPPSDDDYQALKQLKEHQHIAGDRVTEDDLKQTRRSARDTLISVLLKLKHEHNIDIPQREIADHVSKHWEDVSQQTVSNVKRDLVEDGELEG